MANLKTSCFCCILSAVTHGSYNNKINNYLFYFFLEKVDSGIPSIMLPPTSTTIGNHTYEFTEMVSELGVGYMVIPVVAVLANIAIAKAFGELNFTLNQLIINFE